jgi:hypothetical protein
MTGGERGGFGGSLTPAVTIDRAGGWFGLGMRG